MNDTKVLLRSRLNLGFSLNYFSFYFKFSAFRILFFTLHVFKKFYQRMNKTNIDIGNISSFQNGLNDILSSTGFYFNSKVIEGSHKRKKIGFSIFGHFF